MTDFWENWGQKSSEPVPPGVYNATLDEASLNFDGAGRARTSCTFIICEGQPHAGRRIWVDWPHDAGKFGWLARMVYEAFYSERPQGDTPEAVLLSIAKALTESQGRAAKLTTDLRTYTHNGEEKKKERVRRIERLATAAPQPSQPAPQGYGGQGYGGGNQPSVIQTEPDKPSGEPAPWSY